jgi:hypothetical protein
MDTDVTDPSKTNSNDFLLSVKVGKEGMLTQGTSGSYNAHAARTSEISLTLPLVDPPLPPFPISEVDVE